MCNCVFVIGYMGVYFFFLSLSLCTRVCCICIWLRIPGCACEHLILCLCVHAHISSVCKEIQHLCENTLLENIVFIGKTPVTLVIYFRMIYVLSLIMTPNQNYELNISINTPINATIIASLMPSDICQRMAARHCENSACYIILICTRSLSRAECVIDLLTFSSCLERTVRFLSSPSQHWAA